jgi:hypothetical protein
MLEVHLGAECRLELAPVRLEHGRAPVREEIPVLGIHHDRNAARFGLGYHGSDNERHEQALVVVLEDDGVGVIERSQSGVEEILHLAAHFLLHLLELDNVQFKQARLGA